MKHFPNSAFALVALSAAFGTQPANAGSITFATVDDPFAAVGVPPNGGSEVYQLSGSTIVGAYFTAGVAYGFSEIGSIFTNISDPSGSNGNYAIGISGNTIVGVFVDASQKAHGFSETAGVYTTLDDPNAANSTDANGIDGNTIVGVYQDGSGGLHGFTETGGVYTTIDDPNATNNTTVTGISGNTIVGYFRDGSGNFHGFSEVGGIYTTLDIPGSTSTHILGISGGAIVGNFTDGTGMHGFTGTAAPEPASISLFALGTVGLLVCRRKGRSHSNSNDGFERSRPAQVSKSQVMTLARMPSGVQRRGFIGSQHKAPGPSPRPKT